MRPKKVSEIIIPCQTDLPGRPAVDINAKLSDTLKLMVRLGLKQIAVIHKNSLVGMIRLEDAFRELGLQEAMPKDTVLKLKSL